MKRRGMNGVYTNGFFSVGFCFGFSIEVTPTPRGEGSLSLVSFFFSFRVCEQVDASIMKRTKENKLIEPDLA